MASISFDDLIPQGAGAIRFDDLIPEKPEVQGPPIPADYKPPAPSTGEDVGRSFAAGVGRGVIGLGGLPADLGMVVQNYIVDPIQEFTTGKKQERLIPEETVRRYGSEALIRDAASGENTRVPAMPGLAHEPQTTAGKYARTTGEFLPSALLTPGGGGVAARGVQGVTAALGSEAAGQVAQGTAAEPYARIGGAVAGAMAPAAARRAITPFPATPERQAAVDSLRREGVEPTAGQATGNRALQYMESQLGGRGARDALERQGEQFTSAALRRAGENAPRATPEVIDQAFARIGQQFDDLAARNVAVPDRQLGIDIGRVAREYDQLVPPSARAPIVANTGNDILQTIVSNPNGVITGETYQALRSRLDRAARASARDPQLQQALYGFRNALDDVMERSIPAADQEAWREARNQYRNMLVLERAATGAGENAAQGLISPSALRNAAVNTQGRRNYARGDGDFAELARSGEAVLKPLPDSGTASRTAAMAKAGAVGAGVATGNPLPVLAALAPNTAGHILMSRPVQALLANQLMNGVGPSARNASSMALAQALREGGKITNR